MGSLHRPLRAEQPPFTLQPFLQPEMSVETWRWGGGWRHRGGPADTEGRAERPQWAPQNVRAPSLWKANPRFVSSLSGSHGVPWGCLRF